MIWIGLLLLLTQYVAAGEYNHDDLMSFVTVCVRLARIDPELIVNLL